MGKSQKQKTNQRVLDILSKLGIEEPTLPDVDTLGMGEPEDLTYLTPEQQALLTKKKNRTQEQSEA